MTIQSIILFSNLGLGFSVFMTRDKTSNHIFNHVKIPFDKSTVLYVCSQNTGEDDI